jgi:hypothetical protein
VVALRAQVIQPAGWQTDMRQRSEPRLTAMGRPGERLEIKPVTRLNPHKALGLGNRLFLALVAGIFLTRKVALLESAFAASSEVHGNAWLALLRHAQFVAVVKTLWGVVNGRLAVSGEVAPETAQEIKSSLQRNPLFKLFFGQSSWVETLRAEIAALRQQTERLGDIGMELAPAAYLTGVLSQQLRETQVAARDREVLLRNLQENPAWTLNLGRLQVLSREPEGPAREMHLRRLERRLIAALLSELQQPGVDVSYQLAVVRALAVFAPAEQVRLRLAVPAGTQVAYPVFWVPALVLRTPSLRNPLVSFLPAYDDTGAELKPTDPSVIRSLAGSA